jgi:ribosome-binding protein aMBF1 (putative translation factor)
MTRDEYRAYQKYVDGQLATLQHFSSGSWLEECDECPHYGDEEYENGVSYQAEPYFSWSRCELCGSTVGGTREDAHAYYEGQLVHLRICSDCVYYAEYGHLDDQTMSDIEAETESA